MDQKEKGRGEGARVDDEKPDRFLGVSPVVVDFGGHQRMT
jgi:hypothetical protein